LAAAQAVATLTPFGEDRRAWPLRQALIFNQISSRHALRQINGLRPVPDEPAHAIAMGRNRYSHDQDTMP